MKIYEFRIICPTNLEKYQIGNFYMTAKKSQEESKTVKGEGVETVKNEPYTNDKESGIYTYKIMHFKSRIPKSIRWALPDKYCHLHEKSWNAYPHYHTVYEDPGLGNDVECSIDSWHVPYKKGEPIPDNLLNLTPDELKIRHIVYLDILDGKPKPNKERDLSKWKCPALNVNKPFGEYRSDKKSKKDKKDEHEPPDWTNNFDGEMMVAVKVVKLKFHWRGLQSLVEKYATHTVLHNLFLESHRDLMRWADQWGSMTIDDVHRFEAQTYSATNALGFEKDESKSDVEAPQQKPTDVTETEPPESNSDSDSD